LSPPIIWLDTNIIIRFITADHPVMTPEVAAFFLRAEKGQIKLKIASMIIAECCWVLQSPHYNFSPSDIASVLTSLLITKEIDMEEKDVVIQALNLYSMHQVDFIDAYLAAHAKENGQGIIATFNTKDFQKLNVSCNRPSALLL
jgi:predicted nucleic-acid-binding protein